MEENKSNGSNYKSDSANESVTHSAHDETNSFPEKMRLAGNIELTFKFQYVVNEIGGWIIGSDKHFCGQIVALTESEFKNYRKYVSIVSYGELMKGITNDLQQLDTFEKKIEYMNKVKAKYEFDKAYPTGDNTFIDYINERLEKYYELLDSQINRKASVTPQSEKSENKTNTIWDKIITGFTGNFAYAGYSYLKRDFDELMTFCNQISGVKEQFLYLENFNKNYLNTPIEYQHLIADQIFIEKVEREIKYREKVIEFGNNNKIDNAEKNITQKKYRLIWLGTIEQLQNLLNVWIGNDLIQCNQDSIENYIANFEDINENPLTNCEAKPIIWCAYQNELTFCLTELCKNDIKLMNDAEIWKKASSIFRNKLNKPFKSLAVSSQSIPKTSQKLTRLISKIKS